MKLEIMNTVTRRMNKAMFFAKQKSPEILIGSGIVLGIAAAVSACKATLKVEEVVDDAKEKLDKIHEAHEHGATEHGLDGLLYPGEPRASRSRVPSGSRISYDQQYGRRDTSTRPRGISQWDRDFDFSQVLFDDRSDAEAVISGLEANLREYPFVSAAVFYELAGITTDNYQLNKYGWTDLRTASVIRDFRTGKFYIHLPKPLPKPLPID